MITPWEKYVDDTDGHWADYTAWEKWFHEDDQEDILADIGGLASAHIYWKFNQALGANVVKGQYTLGGYECYEPVAFDCSECGAAMAIVNDPKAEQPKYCFGCGVKFDWEGVYEKLIKEMEV